MHALVRTVFSRLHQLDAALEEQKLKDAADEPQETDVKMTVQTDSYSSTAIPPDLQPPSEGNETEGAELEPTESQDVPVEETVTEVVSTPISPGRLPKFQCMRFEGSMLYPHI